VAGAIRKRGGPVIQAECDRIGRCAVGDAVLTGGGNLPARYIIHAVGPVWGDHAPAECDRLLASACRAALDRGEDRELSEIALPSLSTGIYGFPMERAARILLSEAAAHLRRPGSVRRIVFCLFGEEAYGIYRSVLDDV
jgi:O-acetyl-ADP-ribose deacetylase (regulator of RNase III)